MVILNFFIAYNHASSLPTNIRLPYPQGMSRTGTPHALQLFIYENKTNKQTNNKTKRNKAKKKKQKPKKQKQKQKQKQNEQKIKNKNIIDQIAPGSALEVSCLL